MSTKEQAILQVPAGSWQLDIEPTLTPDEWSPETLPVTQEEVTKAVTVPAESPPPLERIIEAILFASSEPLPAQRFSTLIRGLTADELVETIRQLNQRYRQQGRPYTIEHQSAGYRLTLRSRFQHHLEALYGGLKEARFTQFAIETLSVVAYRQPLTQADVEAVMGQECGSTLRLLIRRGLVQLQGKDAEGKVLYAVTPRFLDFFQLGKVEDLPRADDLERL